MRYFVSFLVISLFFSLTSCTDSKQYLGEVTVYEVDIQGLSDKSFEEDGGEAILEDILDKSVRKETPYKVGEYSCKVYRDNDHYAIEYDGEEYVLDELSEPQYGIYNGESLVFHYSIGSMSKVEDLP